MQPYKNVFWPDQLPFFFSVETVWAQAALDTLHNVSLEGYKHFNYEKLYALCLIRHREYVSEVFRSVKQYAVYSGKSSVDVWLRVSLWVTRLLRAAAWRTALRLRKPGPSNGKLTLANEHDVHAARVALDKHLSTLHC